MADQSRNIADQGPRGLEGSSGSQLNSNQRDPSMSYQNSSYNARPLFMANNIRSQNTNQLSATAQPFQPQIEGQLTGMSQPFQPREADQYPDSISYNMRLPSYPQRNPYYHGNSQPHFGPAAVQHLPPPTPAFMPNMAMHQQHFRPRFGPAAIQDLPPTTPGFMPNMANQQHSRPRFGPVAVQNLSPSTPAFMPNITMHQQQHQQLLIDPNEFGNRGGHRDPTRPLNNMIGPGGFTQITTTTHTQSIYQPENPERYPGQHRHQALAREYAPYEYDSGPVEDFSSQPPVSRDEVERRVREHTEQYAASHPAHDTSKFHQMRRIAIQQGRMVETQGPSGPMGKALGPRVSDDVNCCIYLEGLHPQTTYYDLCREIAGKILKTHITRPNRGYQTAAAKVGFFKRADALRTYNYIKAGAMFIRGRQVRIVKWNWDGYTEEQVDFNPAYHSRIIEVKGRRELMDRDKFLDLFKDRIHFDLEGCWKVAGNDDEDGMTTYEFRFGSIPNQSDAAKMILKREPGFQDLYQVSFVEDTCALRQYPQLRHR